MGAIDKTADVQLFTPGRACAGPLAVVLHQYDSGIETLDLSMENCPRRRPAQSPGCHTSFHYGIVGSAFHQYVEQADTAWGFGVTQPTCPAPICPQTPCESCTGLTADQYQPDMSGNPPVLPALVAGPDGTANCGVLHVAVGNMFPVSSLTGPCCEPNPQAYAFLVKSLCQIFDEAGLVPSQSTLLIHCEELDCLDIDQLVLDVLATDCDPAPLPTPCDCPPGPAGPQGPIGPSGAISLNDCDGTALIVGTNVLTADNWQNMPDVTSGILVVNTGSGCPSELDPPLDCASLPPASNYSLIGQSPGSEDGTVTQVRHNFLVNGVSQQATLALTQTILMETPTVLLTTTSGAYTIEPPANACGTNHIWLKNITNSVVTVASSGGELIDGVVSISLDGTTAGTYPFGNNGGEAVHLVWFAGSWYVL